MSALPIENPRRGRQQVDEVGTSLHNLVVDGRRRCKLALATNLSLTQAVQAEDVRSIGMEWLRSVSIAAATTQHHAGAVHTCGTLEYGA